MSKRKKPYDSSASITTYFKKKSGKQCTGPLDFNKYLNNLLYTIALEESSETSGSSSNDESNQEGEVTNQPPSSIATTTHQGTSIMN